jgi:hypothetical protein
VSEQERINCILELQMDPQLYPVFSARKYHPELNESISPPTGSLTFGFSPNNIYIVQYSDENMTVAADVDDVTTYSESNLVVLFTGARSSEPDLCLQLNCADDLQCFERALELCKECFAAALRLNIASRDSFFSGIYDSGCVVKDVEENGEVICTTLQAFIASNRHRDAVSSPGRREKKEVKVASKCFFCQETPKRYAPDSKLVVHPYVDRDFKGGQIQMCSRCIGNWKFYRDEAILNNELVLDGETNEELCALCSAIPDVLVLCSSCPRSFCEVCLSLVLGYNEIKTMKKKDAWTCMVCCTPAITADQSNGGAVESSMTANRPNCQHSIIDGYPQVVSEVRAVPTNEKKKPIKAARKPKCTTSPDVNVLHPVEMPISAVSVLKESDSLNLSVLPPVDKEHDEYYYFGQYCSGLQGNFGIFPFSSPNGPLPSSKLSSDGAGKSFGIEAYQDSVASVNFENSEDYCYLCKDGGELVECDYEYKIFPSDAINETLAGPPQFHDDGVVITSPNKKQKTGFHSHGPTKFRLLKCPKVYHTYCLGFEPPEKGKWYCPAHYCCVCGSMNVCYSCNLCSISLCSACPAAWGATIKERYEYLEMSSIVEYRGTASRPSAPNCVTRKIICATCIGMIKQCTLRGELSRDYDDFISLHRKEFNRNGNITPIDTHVSLAPSISIIPGNSEERVPHIFEQQDTDYLEEYIRNYMGSLSAAAITKSLFLNPDGVARLSRYGTLAVSRKVYRILAKGKKRDRLDEATHSPECSKASLLLDDNKSMNSTQFGLGIDAAFHLTSENEAVGTLAGMVFPSVNNFVQGYAPANMNPSTLSEPEPNIITEARSGVAYVE